MLNTPESDIFVDDQNREWLSFEEIEDAFIEAVEMRNPFEADRINDIMNSYIEWEFERLHGIQATIRVFLF